jgi:hypothetical protein
VWFERFWKRRESEAARPLSQLVREHAELARLLARFGYAPGEQETVQRLLQSLKSLIRAEVTDFVAFRQALRAASQREEDVPRYEVRDRLLMAAAVEAGDNDQAVLAVLNRNPIYEQLPFVERAPVMRRGEVVWLTPVNHACILKRPADPAKFGSLLDELEACFRAPHPARNDLLRGHVVEAIERLRRELKRDRAYFPTGIQFLEARIAAYDSESVDLASRQAQEALSGILENMEKVRCRCAAPSRMAEPERQAALRSARESASRYLADARLQDPWMTNYLAGILLIPALLESPVRGARAARGPAALIRSEIESGYYDAGELIRRLRRLEESGLYVSSVVYGLLAIAAGKPQARRT